MGIGETSVADGTAIFCEGSSSTSRVERAELAPTTPPDMAEQPTNQRVAYRKEVKQLEQLHILCYGVKINVSIAESTLSIGVDTEQDLERIRSMIP